MDDSGSGGCWAGRKEEDSPFLAFLLNHLPLCATNSRSPNLLQNFLKVARSYCSKKLLLKLNHNDGNFSFFTRQMSMVKYYIMQFKTTAFLTFFKPICGRWRFNRGKPNNLSLPCNNVFLVVFLLTIVWKDPKSVSVICLKRMLRDENPLSSRSVLSFVFTTTQHYKGFNGFLKCILLFWKVQFFIRGKEVRAGRFFLWTTLFRCLSPILF